MGCNFAISDVFYLKVLGKCNLQETLQENGKGLDSLGNVILIRGMC